MLSRLTQSARALIAAGVLPAVLQGRHFTVTTFQGERFAIFGYNPTGSSGWLDVDYFHQK